jgi:hypothetical protein
MWYTSDVESSDMLMWHIGDMELGNMVLMLCIGDME